MLLHVCQVALILYCHNESQILYIKYVFDLEHKFRLLHCKGLTFSAVENIQEYTHSKLIRSV